MLRELIPKDKFDTSSFEQLLALSDEQIDEITPDLLTWIQDMNWPVAPYMIKVLSSHREVTESHLLVLLKPEQNDAEWKLHIIRDLLRNWTSFPNDLIMKEIARIASHPTREEKSEEVDVAADEYLEDLA